MKALGLIFILLGSFSIPDISGFLAAGAGLGIIAVEYVYG